MSTASTSPAPSSASASAFSARTPPPSRRARVAWLVLLLSWLSFLLPWGWAGLLLGIALGLCGGVLAIATMFKGGVLLGLFQLLLSLLASPVVLLVGMVYFSGLIDDEQLDARDQHHYERQHEHDSTDTLIDVIDLFI